MHLTFGEDREGDRRRRVSGARLVHHVGESAVRKTHPPHAGVDIVADDPNNRSPADAVKRLPSPFEPVTTDDGPSLRPWNAYVFFWLNRAITRACPNPATIVAAARAIQDCHRESNTELAAQVFDACVPAAASFTGRLDKSPLEHVVRLPLGAAYGLPDGAGPPGDPGRFAHIDFMSRFMFRVDSLRWVCTVHL